MDECVHDMEKEWCGTCNRTDVGPSRLGTSGLHGGETKQDVLDDICRLLGIRRQTVSVGSSLPSEVFAEAARRVGVASGTMPEVCEAIVRKAGLVYSSSFDSRATLSGGGSTVTLEGIQSLRSSLAILLP